MSRDNHAGVGWYDVRTAMNEVSRFHSVRIHLVMSLPIRLDAGVYVNVRAVGLRTGKDSLWNEVAGVGGVWPTTEASTMTGLLLGLVYKLDNKLAQMAADQMLASVQPRLPLF